MAKDHAGDSLLSTGAIEIEIGTVTVVILNTLFHIFSYSSTRLFVGWVILNWVT